MIIKYSNDNALESINGGLGSSPVMSYDSETGVLLQDLTLANEAAWGGGTGHFFVRVENPNAGIKAIGDKGLTKAEF